MKYLIPPGPRWFELQIEDKELRDNPEVKRYLSAITEITYQEMIKSNSSLDFLESEEN